MRVCWVRSCFNCISLHSHWSCRAEPNTRTHTGNKYLKISPLLSCMLLKLTTHNRSWLKFLSKTILFGFKSEAFYFLPRSNLLHVWFRWGFKSSVNCKVPLFIFANLITLRKRPAVVCLTYIRYDTRQSIANPLDQAVIIPRFVFKSHREQFVKKFYTPFFALS